LYNPRLAAEKTKQERKQKRAYQKWAAEVRANGRPAPSRMREPPYAKIKRSGTLNVYEETAADDLLAAYHFSMGTPVQRDSEPDMPTGPRRPDTADYIAAHASDLVKAYQSWRADLCDTIPLRIVKAVLFAETPLSELDASGHWRAGTAKIHFVAGIRHFAMLRGSVPRGAHAWTFDPTKSITDLKKEQTI
jgi:hypothetical protein